MWGVSESGHLIKCVQVHSIECCNLFCLGVEYFFHLFSSTKPKKGIVIMSVWFCNGTATDYLDTFCFAFLLLSFQPREGERARAQ